MVEEAPGERSGWGLGDLTSNGGRGGQETSRALALSARPWPDGDLRAWGPKPPDCGSHLGTCRQWPLGPAGSPG